MIMHTYRTFYFTCKQCLAHTHAHTHTQSTYKNAQSHTNKQVFKTTTASEAKTLNKLTISRQQGWPPNRKCSLVPASEHSAPMSADSQDYI